MPVVRYFLFVGGLLLATLLFVQPYLPHSDLQGAKEREVDRTIIRIQSIERLPERIVYDTQIQILPSPPARIEIAATPVEPAVNSFPAALTQTAEAPLKTPRLKRRARMPRNIVKKSSSFPRTAALEPRAPAAAPWWNKIQHGPMR